LALFIPPFLLLFLVLLSNYLGPVHAESPYIGYGTNVATAFGMGKTDEMGFQWVRIYFP